MMGLRNPQTPVGFAFQLETEGPGRGHPTHALWRDHAFDGVSQAVAQGETATNQRHESTAGSFGPRELSLRCRRVTSVHHLESERTWLNGCSLGQERRDGVLEPKSRIRAGDATRCCANMARRRLFLQALHVRS